MFFCHTFLPIPKKKKNKKTLLFWCYGGGTLGWAAAVGYFRTWSPAKKRTCRILLGECADDPDKATARLDGGVKPASLMKMLVNTPAQRDAFFQLIDGWLSHMDALWPLLRTIAFLVSENPGISRTTIATLLAQAPFWGTRGESGGMHAGPFGTHPRRLPAFWAKEAVSCWPELPALGWKPQDDVYLH